MQIDLEEKALMLVKDHFQFINNGNLSEAKKQLFHPKDMNTKPLDVYIETMDKIKPFSIVSIGIKDKEDVRKKRHGRVATIWIDIEVKCRSGLKTADVSVWWFPETNKMLISARPTHWVLEEI